MDYTDVVGKFGRFQAKFLGIICWRAFCGAVGIIYQLSSFDIGHWCTDSAPDYSQPESQCSLITFDVNSSSNSTIKCSSWSYNNSDYPTIVEEWDLVCDRSWYVSFGYMVFALGNFASYIPAGHLADKYGRHPLALIGQIAVTVITLVSVFSSNMIWFLSFRFLVGVAFGIAQTSILCLYLETVGPRYRDTLVISFSGAWGFGMAIVAGFGYFIPNWRYLTLIMVFVFMVPMIILVWKFVDESCRWLLATKKYDQAKILMIKQAKQNGRVINNPDEVMEILKNQIEEDKRKTQPVFIDLFRNVSLRKRTLILYVVFVLTVFIAHGFTITIGRLPGSRHFNIAIMGFVEVLTIALYFVIVKFFNRRHGLLINFLICGILFLLTLTVSDDLNWLKVTFSMIGHLCNSLAYTLLYVYVAELFPTNLRSVALSGAMSAGRIGGMLAPFNDVLGRNYGISVPNTIYGVLSIITSLVFLLLPETHLEHLPDTVAQSEKLDKIGKNDSPEHIEIPVKSSTEQKHNT